MSGRWANRIAAAIAVGVGAHAAPGATALALNARYTSPGNTYSNVMDVYVPQAGAASTTATVIVIHGGSYNAGDKAEMAPAAMRLADLGYSVVNINYALAFFGPSFPQPITDVYSVIAWIRGTGGAQYGLPSKIIIAGFSAGGTIGSTAALAADVPGAFFRPPNSHPRGFSVDGVFHGFGRADLVWNVQTYGQIGVIANYLGSFMTDAPSQSLYASASAITYVNPCSPPTVLYHGDNDGTVPVGNSIRLAQALVAAGVPTDLHIIHNGTHSFSVTGGDVGTGDTIALAVPWMLTRGQIPCGRDGTPPPTGACCVNTTCVIAAAGACAGFYSGDNTTCANSCPLGACCTAPGTCTLTFQTDCARYWLGAGTVCGPEFCPAPGACCDPDDGSCRLTYVFDCEDDFFEPPAACTPNPCPQPGACCLLGACSIQVELECGLTGGSWLGAQTTCSPNLCPRPGACCDGTGCTLTLADACPGLWFGPNSLCTSNPCAQAAACCTGNNCTLTLRSGCAGQTLTGTLCTPGACEALNQPGACCAGATCGVSIGAQCSGPNRKFFLGAPACNAAGNARTPCCSADYNKDARVSVQDIFAFLGAWFIHDPLADMANNGAGSPTVESIFRYLAAYFAGCPSP